MASESGRTPGTQQPNKDDPNNSKEGKRFFKFVFNVNKKCTDETEMTAEFERDVKHYHEFDAVVTTCIEYVENMFIPFCSKNPKIQMDDSLKSLSTSLNDFKNHVPENYKSSFESFSTKMKATSGARKNHQDIQRRCLDNMKNFHNQQYAAFLQKKKNFDESRRKMDQAKAEVREAKTTTAIEKKAICYQLAVDDFDQVTEELIKYIESLPGTKKEFTYDILTVLSKHKKYHEDMSKFFSLPS
uniref:BAR domain-containing protein n=1 Tax=Caenorhabditis japonica TaxID=281687 RepID=A0A8R1DTC1_CAEJA